MTSLIMAGGGGDIRASSLHFAPPLLALCELLGKRPARAEL